jgi:hypothetical protein
MQLDQILPNKLLSQTWNTIGVALFLYNGKVCKTKLIYKRAIKIMIHEISTLHLSIMDVIPTNTLKIAVLCAPTFAFPFYL